MSEGMDKIAIRNEGNGFISFAIYRDGQEVEYVFPLAVFLQFLSAGADVAEGHQESVELELDIGDYNG